MAIARIWSGRADFAKEDAYPRHFRDKVLPALDQVPGFLGAMLMRREVGGEIEYTVLTRWVSLDAIRKFSGDDIDRAVVDPEAQATLSTWDKTVRHSEILEKVWSSAR